MDLSNHIIDPPILNDADISELTKDLLSLSNSIALFIAEAKAFNMLPSGNPPEKREKEKERTNLSLSFNKLLETMDTFFPLEEEI